MTTFDYILELLRGYFYARYYRRYYYAYAFDSGILAIVTP
jgi:hypothetical protein